MIESYYLCYLQPWPWFYSQVVHLQGHNSWFLSQVTVNIKVRFVYISALYTIWPLYFEYKFCQIIILFYLTIVWCDSEQKVIIIIKWQLYCNLIQQSEEQWVFRNIDSFFVKILIFTNRNQLIENKIVSLVQLLQINAFFHFMLCDRIESGEGKSPNVLWCII